MPIELTAAERRKFADYLTARGKQVSQEIQPLRTGGNESGAKEKEQQAKACQILAAELRTKP